MRDSIELRICVRFSFVFFWLDRVSVLDASYILIDRFQVTSEPD